MKRELMKSKVHRASVTDANLYYEGSITLDSDILHAADILPGEKLQIVNLNNGQRFETYAIVGEAGKGDVCVNGAAARLVSPGDQVIVISYAWYEPAECLQYEPLVVWVDENNHIASKKKGLDGTQSMSCFHEV